MFAPCHDAIRRPAKSGLGKKFRAKQFARNQRIRKPRREPADLGHRGGTRRAGGKRKWRGAERFQRSQPAQRPERHRQPFQPCRGQWQRRRNRHCREWCHRATTHAVPDTPRPPSGAATWRATPRPWPCVNAAASDDLWHSRIANRLQYSKRRARGKDLPAFFTPFRLPPAPRPEPRQNHPIGSL